MLQAGNLARKGILCINFPWPKILPRAIVRDYHVIFSPHLRLSAG
jgi:hypothetical protein